MMSLNFVMIHSDVEKVVGAPCWVIGVLCWVIGVLCWVAQSVKSEKIWPVIGLPEDTVVCSLLG